jgi:hypothetical protein
VARGIGHQILGGLTLLLATFFAVSAVAAAAPGNGRVKAELRLADEALGQVWRESDDEDADDTYDLGAVAANLAHTEAAHQLALTDRRTRAASLAAVNTQADENAYEYADDAWWAPAEQQPALAAALATSLSLRSSVTDAMLVKAEKLTPGARGAVVRSITDALSDGDAKALLEAISDPEGVADATQASFVAALAAVLADTDRTVSDLGRLAVKLDRSERDKVRRAIEEIDGSIAELPEWIDELLVDIAGFADDPDAATQAFCAVLARLPFPRPAACG